MNPCRLIASCALAAAVAFAASLALPSSAAAGLYEVRSCFGSVGHAWIPETNGPYTVSFTGPCVPNEGLVDGSRGDTNAPHWAYARHTFRSPEDTHIVGMTARVHMGMDGGWQAGLYDGDNDRWIWCGVNCLSTFGWQNIAIGHLYTRTIHNQVICVNPGGACGAGQGWMKMQDVVMAIEDLTSPGVAITGGSLVAPGHWARGTERVGVRAWDNTGISRLVISIDGEGKATAANRCSYTSPRPCDDLAAEPQVSTAEVRPDGRHTLVIDAVDASGNGQSTSQFIWVDNTSPTQPEDVTIVAGEGWRTGNKVDVTWRNPSQGSGSPIGALGYQLCPGANRDGDAKGCVSGLIGGRDRTRAELPVPRDGAWKTRLWLRDEAGNENPGGAATAGIVRIDNVPPTLSFKEPGPGGPVRLKVKAGDATSGIARGEISARREGSRTWHALDVEPTADGFAGVLDDANFPDGVYELRARAIDKAGNERSTTTLENGDPATIKLPVRIKSRLVVGKVKKIRARRARRHRRYRRKLIVRPRARYGRTVRLHGRLTTPGANPVADAAVDVYQRVDMPGTAFERIAVVRTSRTGRFTFKALRGPSRILRFSYAGTDAIRPRASEVELRVKAATSFRPSRRHVVNGETVTFRGRLKGRPLPTTGKIVLMQARVAGRWRTFGTTRASPRTGLWAFPYRFQSTRGRQRYRLRAVVPREVNYPYHRGVSHRTRVWVRGL